MKSFMILSALVVLAAALPSNYVMKQEKELLADILGYTKQYLELAQTNHGIVDLLQCHNMSIIIIIVCNVHCCAMNNINFPNFP